MKDVGEGIFLTVIWILIIGIVLGLLILLWKLVLLAILIWIIVIVTGIYQSRSNK